MAISISIPIPIPIQGRKFKPSPIKPWLTSHRVAICLQPSGGLIIATIMRTNSRLHSIWHVILSPERKTCASVDGRVAYNSNTYILLFYYLLLYNFLPAAKAAAAPKLALKLSARFPYKKHCGPTGASVSRFVSTPPFPFPHSIFPLSISIG